MSFHCLFASSVSACFELDNTSPYYAPEPYDVLLDGKAALRGVNTNVFSLFGLEPGKDYTAQVGQDSLPFRTQPESACLDVREFGAAGDGLRDDTQAIQSAVNACPTGGRVTVGPGVYSIRPLVLKSDLTLELRAGAVLRADPVEGHYPVLPGQVGFPGREVQVSSWEGDPRPAHQSILSAWYARNIQIVGPGTIDGNGPASTWWQNVKNRPVGRPKLVFLDHCQDVVFHGILGKNSPSWHFHPFFSKNVAFYNIAVEAPKDSPNTDGMDPESCDGVKCVGIRFSVGDDAIAIKSGKIYMGSKYRTPASGHVIRNCLMEYAHGAVVLGSEMSGGIRDLTVSQCYFSHTDRGMRIKTRRGRGNTCVVDGVEFSNIRMDNVMCPLVINMFYFCDPDGRSEYVGTRKKLPVDERTPYLGSFTFRDMECTDCEWAAGYFCGLPEMPVGQVTIENVRFAFKADASAGYPAMMSGIDKECRRGLYFDCVKSVRLKNVTLEGQAGQEVTAQNVEEVCRE